MRDERASLCASRPPRLLDLFCGVGGASAGYHAAGFEVVGVDIKPQPHYPFSFIQHDALDLNLGYIREFDAIHASPPCQHFSSITRVRSNHHDHPNLIPPTRDLLEASGLPYVIENVERARSELRDPVVICGAACGLEIQDESGKRFRIKRHRLFETNWTLMAPKCACHRNGAEVLGIYGGGTRQDTRVRKNLKGGNTNKANRAQAQALMEMPWATRNEINQAIPPAYTELIGHQLVQHALARVA